MSSILCGMKTSICALFVSMSFVSLAPAAAEADPSREAFREIYKEMVEIDSSQSTGSCTKVVRAAETRLKAARLRRRRRAAS